MSMLSRAFTKKEKGLMLFLAFLILFALYYFTVHMPCKEALAQAKSEKEALETENTVLQARCAKKDAMQAELDEILKNPSAQEVPKYDNLSAVTAYLNAILKPSLSYSISCGDVRYDENAGIYRRPVQIRCNVLGYDKAKNVLEIVRECPYLSMVSNVSMSAYTRRGYQEINNIEDGNVTLNLTMEYYEGK